MRRYTNLLAVVALSAGMALHAQTNEMVIQTKKLGAEIQPTMYGLFFGRYGAAARADEHARGLSGNRKYRSGRKGNAEKRLF